MRLINADAFIEENKEIVDCEIDHPKYQDTLRELIDQAPTIKTFTLADIEEQYRKGLEKGLEEVRPHGKWITTSNIWDDDDLSGWGYYKECSNCHSQVKHRTPYCPYCGADMRKEGEAK